MRRYYKPSGKISALLLLYLPITILLFTPIAGFLNGLVFFYSPLTLLNIIATVISVLTIALLCGHWCVTKAKVRNKFVAWLAALLTTGLFWIFTAISFCLLRYETPAINDLLFLLNPSNLYEALQSAIAEGADFSRGRGTLFTLRGTLLWIILAVGAFLSLVITIFNYLLLAGKPFNEVRGQWAKETEVNLEYINETSAFEEILRFSDLSGLAKLTALQKVNVSYCNIRLFPMSDRYYISAKNRRATGVNKNGKTRYEDVELFEYLMISKKAGDLLLSKRVYAEHEGATTVILNKRARRRDALALFRLVTTTCLFFFAAYQAYAKGQVEPELLTRPFGLMITAAFALYFTLGMVGSYTEEDVIVLDEDIYTGRESPDFTTNPYNIEQRDSGWGYKFYYTLMSIASISLLIYNINLVLR